MTMFISTSAVSFAIARKLRVKAMVLASNEMPNFYQPYTYVTVVMRGKRATVTLWGEEDENFTLCRMGKLRLAREGKGWRVADVRTSSPWYRAMRAAGHSHAVCMEELDEMDAFDLDWSQAVDGPPTPDDVAHPTWGA